MCLLGTADLRILRYVVVDVEVPVVVVDDVDEVELDRVVYETLPYAPAALVSAQYPETPNLKHALSHGLSTV